MSEEKGRKPPRRRSGKPARKPAATAATPKPAANAAKEAARRAALARKRARQRAARRAARIKAQKKRAAQPLPSPPQRRPVPRQPTGRGTAVRTSAPRGAATAQQQQLVAQIQQLQQTFNRLDTQAQLRDVYSEIGTVEGRLAAMPLALNALRKRGYLHAGVLEDELSHFDEKWDEVRPDVERELSQQVQQLDRELANAQRYLNGLTPNNAANSLGAVSGLVDQLAQRISGAEQSLRRQYSPLSNELSHIEQAFRRIEWMLDQIDSSSEIQLRETEGPLMASEAMWQADGEEGPAGLIILTDQRLLFEQKEKVVTKSFLGVFATESETIQKLLLNVPLHEVEQVDASEKGGFLGLGKEEILELVLGPSAPVTRVRFHIQGEDSEVWESLIMKAKSGEIDDDRAEAYTDELEEAAEVAAAFPTQCPNCFAPLPQPARGQRSLTCEYCGSVVTPKSAPSGG